MDIGDKCQDRNNISPIMTHPEELMREIFNYLSFETLFFSLRRVCKNIQTYVDRYLKVRGTSFLVGYQEDSKKQVIEIIKKLKEGFITRMKVCWHNETKDSIAHKHLLVFKTFE